MNLELFEPLAVFQFNENNGYNVFSPNVPGAISEGKTLEEARAMIQEAIEGVIHVALEEEYNKYFNNEPYKANQGEIVETICINQRLQVAITLRMAREKAGITQAQAAEKIGVRQQHISRWEKGVMVPSADSFLKLVTLFLGNNQDHQLECSKP